MKFRYLCVSIKVLSSEHSYLDSEGHDAQAGRKEGSHGRNEMQNEGGVKIPRDFPPFRVQHCKIKLLLGFVTSGVSYLVLVEIVSKSKFQRLIHG